MSDDYIKSVVHPLGCPLDEIQLPMCLGKECEEWMVCEAYKRTRQGQGDIEEQTKRGIREWNND